MAISSRGIMRMEEYPDYEFLGKIEMGITK